MITFKIVPRIDERLKEIGRTKAWLARQMGTDDNAVRKHASGRIIPSLGTAFNYAAVLRCTIEHLWRVEEVETDE